MYTFENTDTLEMDLYFEHAKYILSGMPSSDDIEYFTEGENIISRAIEAIAKALKAFFKKIGEILTGKKREETANALEEAIKQNPKLGKEKVEVHDYTEMRKLQKDTLNELKKPNCDTQKTMEEYKKKRKGLLVKMGIGAGITAAVAGTAITAAVLCKKLTNPESVKQFASKLGASFHKDTTDVMGKNVGDGDQSSAAQGATTVLNDGLRDATDEIKSQEAAGRKVLKLQKRSAFHPYGKKVNIPTITKDEDRKRNHDNGEWRHDNFLLGMRSITKQLSPVSFYKDEKIRKDLERYKQLTDYKSKKECKDSIIKRMMEMNGHTVSDLHTLDDYAEQPVLDEYYRCRSICNTMLEYSKKEWEELLADKKAGAEHVRSVLNRKMRKAELKDSKKKAGN